MPATEAAKLEPIVQRQAVSILRKRGDADRCTTQTELLGQGSLLVYTGFDATIDSLHAEHFLPIIVLLLAFGDGPGEAVLVSNVDWLDTLLRDVGRNRANFDLATVSNAVTVVEYEKTIFRETSEKLAAFRGTLACRRGQRPALPRGQARRLRQLGLRPPENVRIVNCGAGLGARITPLGPVVPENPL
ncbi:MAG: hypothetical protein LC130_10905 [Bryobacterales bacterium]|nr:hypothetical protein [Bryobacterales bacterium]